MSRSERASAAAALQLALAGAGTGALGGFAGGVYGHSFVGGAHGTIEQVLRGAR
jgi:hypothetical protein